MTSQLGCEVVMMPRGAGPRRLRLRRPARPGPIDNAELAWGPDVFLAFHDTPDLTAGNLSQPHLNEMEAVHRSTVDHLLFPTPPASRI